MMVQDFQREIIEPRKKNLSETERYNNTINRILGSYGDPEAQAILRNGPKNDYDKTLLNMNPNLQRDYNRISALDKITSRLANQRQMLDNDYLSLFGQSLSEVDRPKQDIQRQTDEMLKGSALGQTRMQGFALGQATKRGDSEAMKQKIIGDAASQGAMQRSQIQAQQQERMLQAQANKQQILLSIAQALQQQQQQNFQNQLIQQQQQAKQQQQVKQQAKQQQKQQQTNIISSIINKLINGA